ncbi:hypothetical protein K523DRAFT_362013 [Schizophyllum commune Tattone D]|nr:hypothetical protein K523DRAFT_362013 [Schizophyllum commune Tattone D]
MALLASWLLPFILATASVESMPSRRDTPLPVAVNAPPATTLPHAVRQTAIAAVLRTSPLIMSLYALMTLAIGYIWHTLWCRRSDARRNTGHGWRRLNERELDLLPTTADPEHDGSVPPPHVPDAKPRSSLQLPDRAGGRWRPLHEKHTRRSHSVSSLRTVPPAIPRPMSPALPTANRRAGTPGPSRLSDDRPLIDLVSASADDRAKSTPLPYDFATNALGTAHVWASASNDSLPLSDDVGIFGPREWRHPVLPAPARSQSPASSSSVNSRHSSDALLNEDSAGVSTTTLPAPQPSPEEHELIDWSDSLSPPPSPSQALQDLIRFDEEREKQSMKDGVVPTRPAMPVKRNAIDVAVRPLSPVVPPLQVDELSQVDAPAIPVKEAAVVEETAAVPEPAADASSALRKVIEEHNIPKCESPASISEPLPLFIRPAPEPIVVPGPDDTLSAPDDSLSAPDDGDTCSVNFEVVTPTESNFSIASSSPELHRAPLPAEPVLTPVAEVPSWAAEVQDAVRDEDEPEDAYFAHAQPDARPDSVNDSVYYSDTDSVSSESEHDADVSSVGDEDDEPEMPEPSAPVEAHVFVDDDVPPFFLESPVDEEAPDPEDTQSPMISQGSRSLSIDIASLKKQSLGSALPSPTEERLTQDAAERTPTASKAQSPVESAPTPPAVAISPTDFVTSPTDVVTSPIEVAASPIELAIDSASRALLEKSEEPDTALSVVCQPVPAQTPTPPSSPPMPPSAGTKKRPAWSVRALEAPQLSYTRTKSSDAGRSDSISKSDSASESQKKLEVSPRASSKAENAEVEKTPEVAKDEAEQAVTPRLAAPQPIVRQSSVPGGFPGTNIDDEFEDPPLLELPPKSPSSEQQTSPWKFRFPTRPEPLTLDVALTMQLRPGIGVNSDPAWMVRFLMAAFGWLGVLAAGGEGF